MASEENEDAAIVDRAELIAVGHLKENSIQYVPHPNTPQEDKNYVELERISRPEITNPIPHPMSWEHQAILVITETIKGNPSGKEIPIVINYGLQPRIGGYVNEGGVIRDVRGDRKDYPTNLVQIFPRQGSMMIFDGEPVVDDAGKDYIWFLRRGGIYRGNLGTNDLGVMNSGDIEPLKMREYFELYLSGHPEVSVKAYAEKHPEVSYRVQRWLTHLEIKRLVKIEDPSLRFEGLLPHFLKPEGYSEIREGIVSCGAVGGEKLIPVFQDPGHQDRRMDIISIWGSMNYRPAVPLLIQVLEEGDRFWAGQTVTNDCWQDQSGSELTLKRRASSGEIYYSVSVLRHLHDPRALEAIAMTKRRWESIPFADPRILENCNAALDPRMGLNLAGTARNPAGQPVTGAVVRVWPDGYFNSHSEVKTDAGGRYEIAWELFAFDGQTFLVVRSVEKNLVVAQPMERGITNLDVSLQPGLTLVTKIEDGNGMPVTNAFLSVGVNGGKLWLYGCKTDAQGRAEVNAVPQENGTYNLNVTAEGFRNGYKQMLFQVGKTNRLVFPTVVLVRMTNGAQ